MADIQTARIHTAGVYVCVNGLYVFTIATKPQQDFIPIVRLGGHCERSETGWQCAEREALEEAGLRIRPFAPPATYFCDWETLETGPSRIRWQREAPDPFLVIARRREGTTTLSLMYLAQAEGTPAPSSEVMGLILLDEAEIHRLCQEPVTLEQYLARGGQAVLKEKFDTRLVLEPFAQLRLLSKIIRMEPGTTAACQNRSPSDPAPRL